MLYPLKGLVEKAIRLFGSEKITKGDRGLRGDGSQKVKKHPALLKLAQERGGGRGKTEVGRSPTAAEGKIPH